MRPNRIQISALALIVLTLVLVRWLRPSLPHDQSSVVDPASDRAAAAVKRVPLLSTAVTPSAPAQRNLRPSRMLPIVDAAPGVRAHPDNRFPLRLRNTDASVDALIHSDSAILLRHALVDTRSGEPLEIPAHLRSAADPGTYIVQSAGPIQSGFRRAVRDAGGEVVSYIPNNALLVRLSAESLKRLDADPSVGSILPFEPYFKLDADLLENAVARTAPPVGTIVWVTVSGGVEALKEVERIGGPILESSKSPFGQLVAVELRPAALPALSQLGGVTGIEVYRRRVLANDLAGYIVGSSTDADNKVPFLGLTGKGVVVGLNDMGVDLGHPAIQSSILPLPPTVQSELTNGWNGHGTHVAGIIVGNGSGSILAHPQGSPTNSGFRGRAPGAKLYVQPVDLDLGPTRSDEFIQTNGAAHEVRISNNSWAYRGTRDYSSASASYDAAVRDSLPGVPGAQPVIYVFAAGNEGAGDDIGTGGTEDSISAPANAKNVITIGALETLRGLTNSVVTDTNGMIIPKSQIDTNAEPGTYTTNVVLLSQTDSAAQVANYSSRGNVGVGIEGDSGRFKPDLVAPGSFIVSARAKGWKLSDDEEKGTIAYEALYELDNQLGGDPEDPGIGNAYRFSSGTSMAAPSVSGILAQLDEFFESVAKTNRPSPALARALLVNGARPTSDSYAVDPHEVVNYAGWGLANIANSLPRNWASDFNQPPSPLLFIEESYTNALATGQSRSWRLRLNKANTNLPLATLRFSLAWTDPAGNPAASVKLVNDLDLIVTSRNTNAGVTKFWYGNDYVPNVNLTRERQRTETAVDPENPPTALADDPTRLDRINNLENITIAKPDDDLIVTVVGRRVNVQSLGVDHQDGAESELTLQDWTLVVSVDAPDALGLIEKFEFTGAKSDQLPEFLPPVDILTNGSPRLRERVGANSPRFAGVDGTLAQWHFYTFTNYRNATNANGTVYGSNVAFTVFGVPGLALPRNDEADVDLYVSFDPGLTNLVPSVVASAFRSASRLGSEHVVFTNAPNTNEIFYVGVKSEDQQAAEYNIVGISTDQPFNRRDPDGRIRIQGIPLSPSIPDGTPRQPGRGDFMGIGPAAGELRSILAEQTWTHEQYSDVLGSLQHLRRFAVINNHNEFGGYRAGTNILRVYDDSFSGGRVRVFGRYIPGMQGIAEFQTNAYPVDGPGTLNNFLGERIDGVWMFSSFDDAAGFVGRVNQFDLRVLENDLLDGRFHHRTVQPGRCELEVMNVPADVSRMRVIVTNITPAVPLKVLIRRAEVPDLVNADNNDKNADLLPPGGELSIGLRDVPPLVAGRYFIAVCNPNAVAVEYDIAIILERNLDAKFTRVVTGTESFTNQDLALGSVSTNLDDGRIVTGVRVGVRIDQPQVSDLKIHLANSSGRALVVENRGLRQAVQYGTDLVTSNFQHVAVTYDHASATLRLFHNGLKVGETVARGLSLPTNSNLHFGRDASRNVSAVAMPLAIDDFGLWRRAISDDDVRRIFEEGAFGRGKDLSDKTKLLIGHWRFDGSGDESINGLDAAVVSPVSTVDGQIGFAMSLDGDRSDVLLGSSTVRELQLDAGKRVGFTIEGWIRPATTPTNIVVASFWSGRAAERGFPALLVGFDAPLGRGVGSLSAVFATTNGGSVTLSSRPSLVTRDGVVTNIIYAQFSDATNEATVPIKFATPPYTGLIPTSTPQFTNSFEGPDKRYNVGETVDGWEVLSDSVQARTEPAFANSGANYLQMRNGTIQRTFATVPGRIYDVTFTTRRSTGEPGQPQVGLYVNGVLDRIVESSSRWRTNFLSFRAFQDTAVIVFRAITPAPGPTNTTPGLGLDTFRVEAAAGTFSYLPEEPLLPLLGRSGAGDWRLDLTDDRGGVADAILRGWQLTLLYAPTNTPAVRLTNTVTYDACRQGASLKNGELQYFYVDVPLEAQAVTNILERVSGNSGIDLLYSATGLPDGNQDDDVVLLENVVGTATAGITRTLPPLLPRGQRYYLAVRNTDPDDSETCYRLTVRFGVPITTLTNCVPYTSTNRNEGLLNYYAINVPADALTMRVTVTNMNEDVNMVVRRAPLLPTQAQFDYSSEELGTNPEFVRVSAGKLPVPLQPGLWYIGVYPASTNLSVRDLVYTVTACASGGESSALTNNVALVVTNALDDIQYFYFDVKEDLISLDLQVDPIVGNVDVVLGNDRLPDRDNYDARGNRPGLASEGFLMLRETPAPLTVGRGRWWLGVYPVDAPPVSFRVTASAVSDDGSIVDLFNGLEYKPGLKPAPGTNYYRFNVAEAETTTGVMFEIYDLTGDADLYARRGTLPKADRFFYSSAQLGKPREAIALRTNQIPTAILYGDWYLAVVVKDPPSVSYTIRAVVEEFGILVSGEPFMAAMQPPTDPGDFAELLFHSTPGERYGIEYSDSLEPANWIQLSEVVADSLVTTLKIPKGPGDVPSRFYRVVQIPKTSP